MKKILLYFLGTFVIIISFLIIYHCYSNYKKHFFNYDLTLIENVPVSKITKEYSGMRKRTKYSKPFKTYSFRIEALYKKDTIILYLYTEKLKYPSDYHELNSHLKIINTLKGEKKYVDIVRKSRKETAEYIIKQDYINCDKFNNCIINKSTLNEELTEIIKILLLGIVLMFFGGVFIKKAMFSKSIQ